MSAQQQVGAGLPWNILGMDSSTAMVLSHAHRMLAVDTLSTDHHMLMS